MSEQFPRHPGDHPPDSERVAGVPPYGSQGVEQTSALPPYWQQPPPVPPGPLRREGRGRAGTAGLLAAALLVGGAAGVGGAAAYDGLVDEEITVTTQAGTQPLRTSTSEQGGTADTPADEGSAEAVASQVLPSVVKIEVSGEEGAGSGSGIVLSEDGDILTNQHVVEVAEDGGRVAVSFEDGTVARARIVGTDPVTDLAVIRAQGVSGRTPATIGDSDALDVGEAVVAIGSPFGLEATVTSGIVSAVDRPVSVGQPAAGGDSTTYPAIQTDAAINPGNSGGPLVNVAGEVIGVNSSIRSSSSSLGGEGGSIGLGFAIPISKVLPIVEQLRAGETPTHARLGVTVSDQLISDGLIRGAAIESIEDGSAAEEAGLRSGDIVTRVDDVAVTSTEALVATIRGYRPGDTVRLLVVRDGETQEVEATLDSDAE